MAIPFDIDVSLDNRPSLIDPAETLNREERPLTPDELGQIINAPPPVSPHELGEILTGGARVEMGQPAPQDREAQEQLLRRLRYEKEYELDPQSKLTGLSRINIAPEGLNPRTVYEPSEIGGGNFVTDTFAQYGLGGWEGASHIKSKLMGLLAATTPIKVVKEDLEERAKGARQYGEQMEKVGQQTGGVPGVRGLTSMVVGTAPEMIAGGVGGLPAMAAAFGVGTAPEMLAFAKEQGYEHPETYALLSSLIVAGTSLIPGYKGRNLVAKAAELTASPSWKAYFQKQVQQYGTGKLLATHGGSNALMMAVQSTLQGLLDQQTVNPNLTWKDIVVSAATSAGIGAAMGEGFGVLGQDASMAGRKQAVGSLLKPIHAAIEGYEPAVDETRPINIGTKQPSQRAVAGQQTAAGYRLLQAIHQAKNPQELQQLVPAINGARPFVGRNEYVAIQQALQKQIKFYGIHERVQPPVEGQEESYFDAQRRNQPATPTGAVVGSLRKVAPKSVPLTPEEQAIELARYEDEKVEPESPPTNIVKPKFPKKLQPKDIKPGLGVTIKPPPEDVIELVGHLMNKAGQRIEFMDLEPGENAGVIFYVPDTGEKIPISDLMHGIYSYRVGKDNKSMFDTVLWAKSTMEQHRATGKIVPLEPEPEVVPTKIVQPKGTRLPMKGEKMPLGENFYITRTVQGKVVIRAEGSPTAIAVLRSRNAGALTERAFLQDMILYERGQKTKFWDFTGQKFAGAAEIRQEELLANPEQTRAAIVENVDKSRTALRQLIGSDSVSINTLIALARGQKTGARARTPAEVAAKLQELVDKAVPKYLKGKLLVRERVGERGLPPSEIQETRRELDEETGQQHDVPTGNILSEKAIRAKVADVDARVLEILAQNKLVDLQVQEAKKVEAVTPPPAEEVHGTELEKITKTGFEGSDEVTKFTDEMLQSEGKLDKAKVKAAEAVNEIKESLLAGEKADYDAAIETLTKTFGFTREKAEQWMDSDQSLLSPRQSSDTVTGRLRPATELEFKDPELHGVYKERGLLESTPVKALEVIAADKRGHFAPVAEWFLRHRAELDKIKLGNVGGGSRTVGSYSTDNNTIKVSILKNTNINELDTVVLHEVAHGLTVRKYESLPTDHPLVNELLELRTRAVQHAGAALGDAAVEASGLMTNTGLKSNTILDRMVKKYGLNSSESDILYGLMSDLEFIAQFFSEPRFLDFLRTVPGEGPAPASSLWDSIKQWVHKLLNTFFVPGTAKKEIQQSIIPEVVAALNKIMDLPAVGNVEWLESQRGIGDIEVNYPEIRKPKQFEEAYEFQKEERPAQESEILVRKAIANNSFIVAPDVQTIIQGVSKEAQSLLKTIIGSRLDTLKLTEGKPGADKPSDLRAVLDDPDLPRERKSEISLSVLHNVMWFRHQTKSLANKLEKKVSQLIALLPKLDEGITKSTADAMAIDASINRLVGDFKGIIMLEREKAVTHEQVEQLNQYIALADEVKGRRTATSRVLEEAANRIDLETLLSTTEPKELQALIEAAVPPTSETAQKIGASEETIRIASIVMARSNVVREELLTLKFLKDDALKQSLFELNEVINVGLKARNINQVMDTFANRLGGMSRKQERALQVYRGLWADKAKRLNTIQRMVEASDALNGVIQTPSYRTFEDTLLVQNQAMKPMQARLNSGQTEYTHPETGEKIIIGNSFELDVAGENLAKLADLASAAKVYVSRLEAKNYDPWEASFWKVFLRNSEFLLDPSINAPRQRIAGARLDPYKLTHLTGGIVMIPNHVARRVGGSAAVKLQAELQAYGAVDSQLTAWKKKWDAKIYRSADVAAKAHKLSDDTWHWEVLNPIIASHQTTGYSPLDVGARTIYGHTITAFDMKAFRTQVDFDRGVVKIATTGHGNPAVLFDPSKVTFAGPGQQTLQRAIMSGGKTTMSRRVSNRAQAWATQWFDSADIPSRLDFLNATFDPVVMGHLYTVGAPDYAIKSPLVDLYKVVVSKHKANPLTSVEEAVDAIFDAQTSAPEVQVSKTFILETLFKELTTAFRSVSSYSAGAPKTDVGALLRVIDTDNSFTNARGKLIAPTTFYEYGLTFEPNIIHRIHSAKAYYTLNIAGTNGSLDQLIAAVTAHINKSEQQIRQKVGAGASEEEARKGVQAETRQRQLDGNLLLNYQEALDALKQLNTLKNEMVRVLSGTGSINDPDTRQLTSTVQSAVASNILAGVQSQNTNAFGGIANLVLADKILLGRSATLSSLRLLGRILFVEGPNETLTILSRAIDPHDKWFKQALLSPGIKPLGKLLWNIIETRIKDYAELERLGIAPVANVLEDMAALKEMPMKGGRTQPGSSTLTQKIVRTGESGLLTIATPLSAVAPRLMDRFINRLATVKRVDDIETMLRKSAVRSYEAREKAGVSLDEPLTPQELFGQRSATDRQAIFFRELLARERIALDPLMRRYYAQIKAGNREASLFTPEERSAFRYSFAQEINLPTFPTRPLSGRGSRGRNLLGMFYGFPSWQAAQFSNYISRLSTDKNALPYVGTSIVATLTLAALGALSLANTNMLRKVFYGENTGYPDITKAQDADDAARALTVGLFTYVPFLGNIVNGMILNSPTRTGFDINTQFVMLNFLNDMFNTSKKIIQTHELGYPMTDFLRRWSPLARIAVNRLPSQEGLTEYYNLSRELKNIAPDSMETRKRGKGTFDATPVTPMLQSMVNAAYRDDGAGFQKAADDYVQYKQSEGMSYEAAQRALQGAWRSRHPFVREFGRMPTGGEQAIIYNNASPEERRAIDHANEVFQTFGTILGSSMAQEGKEPGAAGKVILPSPGGGAASTRGSLRRAPMGLGLTGAGPASLGITGIGNKEALGLSAGAPGLGMSDGVSVRPSAKRSSRAKRRGSLRVKKGRTIRGPRFRVSPKIRVPGRGRKVRVPKPRKLGSLVRVVR